MALVLGHPLDNKHNLSNKLKQESAVIARACQKINSSMEFISQHNREVLMNRVVNDSAHEFMETAFAQMFTRIFPCWVPSSLCFL